MNIREFKRNINMGLGSAILELMKEPENNEQYRTAVLYACLHNNCCDVICEKGRHYYLFEAINLVGDLDYFESKIIECFGKTNDYNITGQLCGLLFLFWENGSDKAAEVLQEKLDELIHKLPHITRYSGKANPRENVEQIAIWLYDIYGIKSFYDTVKKFGTILMKSKRENVIWYDWFLSNAEDEFGEKRIYKGLEREALKSPEIKRFLDEVNIEAKKEEERQNISKTDTISIQDLIDASKNNQKSRVLGYGRRLARKASTEELIEIAKKIDDLDDLKIKIALLSVFRAVDYPRSIDNLLEIYDTGNDELQEMVLKVLARFKHKQIHELAVYNLENGIHIPESLGLLEKNFKDEYELILKILKSHKQSMEYDYHSLTMAIRKIFGKRKNSKVKEILLFDYKKNRCSFCREHIVEIMCKSKCIPDNILEECLYDCSEDTQITAYKYKMKYKH